MTVGNTVSSARALFYSPFSFLKEAKFLGEEWLADIKIAYGKGEVDRFEDESSICIYYRKLEWDSEFFGVPCFRVDFTDVPMHASYIDLQAAFSRLRSYIGTLAQEYYLFAEVPCEDTSVIAGMSGSGWRLIETRVTCYREDVQDFYFSKRYAVRNATEGDISSLRDAAMEAVNHYDRFHADEFFSKKEANEFLAIFVENSVKGFADEVIVPADGVANAFLTGNYLVSPPSLAKRKMGKMVLSAVTSARKGWYVKLIAELSFKFKERGLDTVFMTTQATNRAVLNVWSRHGYKFGRCSHIFSTYIRKG